MRPGGERRPDPRDRVVVRRDRHRAHRGRPADPRQRRGLAGRAPRPDRRDRARGRGPRPPALDRAGPRRGLGRRRRRVGRHRRRSRSPTDRAWPGSLLVGINFAKALAWVHDRPLVGVNHLEGHVYAAWLRDPGEDGPARSGLPARGARRVGRPHVPRRDARPPDLSAPGHDRRRRRRRGVRQGRAAARPRLSGRTGDRAGGGGRDAPRPGLPARLARRFVRLQLLRAQDGRAPDHRRGARRRRAGRDARGAAPRRRRGRARVGVPGRGRRRPRDQDDPGGARRPAPLDRARRRASPPTARCAPGWPARPRRSGCRSSCRDRPCAPTTGR